MAVRKTISVVSITICLFMAGCGVERTMLVESDPPGAIVYVNDQEFGRTPLRRDFIWYGNYDVVVRAEGYETLKTNAWVVAPWWQWPPFDLFAEVLPFRPKDQRSLKFSLEPASTQPVDPDQILARAAEMEGMLESSRVKPAHATNPDR